MSQITELFNKIGHYEVNGDDIIFFERPVVVPINTPRGEVDNYFQSLAIEAQSKQKDFRKLANREFGSVWLGKHADGADIHPKDITPETIVSDQPLAAKFSTKHGYQGAEMYGFKVPELDKKYLTDDHILIWFPQVTVKQSLL